MKVFVTGMGALTSLGNTVDTFFTALAENRSGVKFFPEWKNYNGLNSFVGAPVPEYDISSLPRTIRRAMSRMSEMAALATFQALEQSQLPKENLISPKTLIILGSTSGSPFTLETYFRKIIEKNGPEGQVSTSFFKTMNHSVAANVAAALEFNGALMSPSCACATSTQSIIMGWELIKAGLYDVVIAGGADELHYLSASIFDIVHAASRTEDPRIASRPFHKDRDGLVVSEGAGVVILESEQYLNSRKGKPIAEILGGTYLCDGTHMTQSSAKTMEKVIQYSLEKSDLKPSDIDYVNAHATGTLHGDIEEGRAISEVFGNQVPVSSLKGHMGHSLAACGALEMIASIKMMENELLIPTLNLDKVDTDCGNLQHIQKNRVAKIDKVLSNNFAFGGMNTSIVFSKV